MRDRKQMSRRRLLAGAALAGCGAAAGLAGRAAADDSKVSKLDAKYQATPKPEQRCEMCLQFLPPNQCKIVEGAIVPTGWCQFFAARENAQ